MDLYFFTEGEFLAYVGHGYLLRPADDNGPVDARDAGHHLRETDVLVTRTGRGVHEEDVERTPVYIFQELEACSIGDGEGEG